MQGCRRGFQRGGGWLKLLGGLRGRWVDLVRGGEVFRKHCFADVCVFLLFVGGRSTGFVMQCLAMRCFVIS